MLQSFTNRKKNIQRRLEIGRPDDIYEREADAVADSVMKMTPVSSLQMKPVRQMPDIQMKCKECEEDEKLQMHADGNKMQMKPESGQTEPPESFTSKLNCSMASGQPLPKPVNSEMSHRMTSDFSHVRVHTDDNAIQMSQEIGAQAFTYGSDIYFNKGKYSPNSSQGRWLLAHELTHVEQQKGLSTVNRKIQKASITQFRSDLESISADHKTVIEELFKHPKFTPMVKFLKGCPAGTINFQVKRIQQLVNGILVDLFGGYSRPLASSTGTMTVNPKRPEHKSNPLEVVDTVVHEFLHAIIDLKSTCSSSSNPFPLAANIKDAFSDPELGPLVAAEIASGGRDPFKRDRVAHHHAAGVTTASGGNIIEYMENNYGPSASRPETHYVDLNRQGLELVTSIIGDIKTKHPKIGKETVSFDNVELMKAAAFLPIRSWLNNAQFSWSMGKFKDGVADKRKIDKSTFTEREYKTSAIQVVEFADKKVFNSNTSGGFGNIGGVWICYKKSRYTGKTLKTAVTGTKSAPPGGGTDYKIVHHL